MLSKILFPTFRIQWFWWPQLSLVIGIQIVVLFNWTWWRKKRSGSATVWIYPNACTIYVKVVGWQSVHKTKNVSHRLTTNCDGSNWPNIFCIISTLKMLRWVLFLFFILFLFLFFNLFSFRFRFIGLNSVSFVIIWVYSIVWFMFQFWFCSFNLILLTE